MHIYCRGQGSPTLIVEQGLGSQSLSWDPLNERLSHITTVCACDRAGMGYSDPIDRPTRAQDVARNLHTLLQEAGISGDLAFVAWSAGGLYAREYYRQFPDHVKGMVLVDSVHEQQVYRLGSPLDNGFDPLKLDQYLAPLGWFRLNGDIERRFSRAPFPEALRERLIAINLKSHMPRTLLNESEGLDADLAEDRPPPQLGNIPLIVLAEGRPNIAFMQQHLKTWLRLQQELAHLSTDGRLVVATTSAHAIQRTQPELIIKSVDQVVVAVRSGATLQ